jgi:hypothetical protein
MSSETDWYHRGVSGDYIDNLPSLIRNCERFHSRFALIRGDIFDIFEHIYNDHPNIGILTALTFPYCLPQNEELTILEYDATYEDNCQNFLHTSNMLYILHLDDEQIRFLLIHVTIWSTLAHFEHRYFAIINCPPYCYRPCEILDINSKGKVKAAVFPTSPTIIKTPRLAIHGMTSLTFLPASPSAEIRTTTYNGVILCYEFHLVKCDISLILVLHPPTTEMTKQCILAIPAHPHISTSPSSEPFGFNFQVAFYLQV